MPIIKKNTFEYFSWAICIAYTGLFFSIPFSNAGLIILFLTSLLCLNVVDFKQALKNNRDAQLLVAFYVLHAVALLYTQNMTTGLFVLEKKITLLLMPLVVFPVFSTMNRAEKSKLLKRLGLITIGSSVAFIVIALLKQRLYNFTLAFHQDYFPSIPYVYYAIYFATFSLILLNELAMQQTNGRTGIFVMVLLVAYSLAILVLIASKTGLIAYVSGLILFLLLRLRSKKMLLGSLAGVVLCLVIMLWLLPSTLDRFTELKSNLAMLYEDKVNLDEKFTGLNLRLFFWKTAVTQLWKDSLMLFGTGTGDAQDYLDQAYVARNLDHYGYIHFDPHNQWIETLLQLGLVGIFLLGAVLLRPALRALRSADANLFFFIWVVACFSFSESILESNKGIVFFALGYCLLVGRDRKVTATLSETDARHGPRSNTP